MNQPTPEPPARFRDLVAAEWIKLRSLRSTSWTVVLVSAFVIADAVVAARGDYSNFPTYSPEVQQDPGFALGDAFPLVGYLALMVVAASLGAITILNEYGSGSIRTTMMAVPARGSVLLAKAVVVALLWTVAGAVIAATSFALSQAILSGRGAGDSITHPGAAPAVVAATLLPPVCALIGLGIGVLIRHIATTIVTTVVTLVIAPMLVSRNTPVTVRINHMMVLSAWQRLTENYGSPVAVGPRYASLTGSWIVYVSWPLIAVVLAVIVIRRQTL